MGSSSCPVVASSIDAAEDDRVGPLGVDGQPPEHLDLGLDESAHGRRELLRDVVDRRLLPVDDAETVGHVQVGQRRQLAREGGALLAVATIAAAVGAAVLESRRPDSHVRRIARF